MQTLKEIHLKKNLKIVLFAIFLITFTLHGKSQSKIFNLIVNYPTVKDTAFFIKELRKVYDLEVDTASAGFKEKINYFNKISLYGSNNNFILLEYDYSDGCEAAYPYKYQFLFTTDGKLIQQFNAMRFELIKIFNNQNPFLLLVLVTAKGNGGHEIYKVSGDKIENVYDGFTDYFPRTFDAHDDNNINSPFELKLSIKDENGDGINDLIFSGSIIHNQVDTIPVKYIFLYKKDTRHFKEKEDYSKKYMYLDSN